MRAPRVSIVMASYNHAPYIGRAIETVINQTFSDFEFLIADDGSTDDTPEVVSQFTDPRIAFTRHDRNRGYAEVINELLHRCRGEYVAMTDSDNFWPLDKLKYQVDLLDRYPERAAVFGDAVFVDKDDVPLKVPPLTFFTQPDRSRGAWLRRFFELGNCLCDTTVLIRRTCFETLGSYDNRLRQLADFDMWIRFVKGYAFFMSDRALTYYRILPGQNASEPTPENVVRSTAEHFLLADRFFDGVDRDLLMEGFADLVILPELPSELHCDIEKALLFFRPVALYGPAYRVVGLQKLDRLLDSAPHRGVLQRDYGIDDLVFQQLAATVDNFKVASEGGAASSSIDEWLPESTSQFSASGTGTKAAALAAPTSAPVEEPPDAGMTPTSFTRDPASGIENMGIGGVLYVAGSDVGSGQCPTMRDFPLLKRTKGESKAAHLARVVRQVYQAMASGATHLVVPREHADWLSDHPRVADYFADHHDLTEASAETGLVFTLRPPGSHRRSR